MRIVYVLKRDADSEYSVLINCINTLHFNRHFSVNNIALVKVEANVLNLKEHDSAFCGTPS